MYSLDMLFFEIKKRKVPMKKTLLLISIIFMTLPSIATELKRDGWNLISVCQDMNRSDIDMANIEEIQRQDGHTIYTGAYADFSNLDGLVSGYGYWIKGAKGVNFSSGEVQNRLEKPLLRNGWNLIASCEDRAKADINMTNIEEIQSQDGDTIYTGIYADFSNLDGLVSGYGYWVKGDAGTLFNAYRGNGSCTEVTDTFPNFIIAKDNMLKDVSKLFNGLTVTATTDSEVTETSMSTNALYGVIDGASTNALLKLNSNYSGGSRFVVKVYRAGMLVGIGTEKVFDASSISINFGVIDSLHCDGE